MSRLNTPPPGKWSDISFDMNLWEDHRIYGITVIKKRIIARNHPMNFWFQYDNNCKMSNTLYFCIKFLGGFHYSFTRQSSSGLTLGVSGWTTIFRTLNEHGLCKKFFNEVSCLKSSAWPHIYLLIYNSKYHVNLIVIFLSFMRRITFGDASHSRPFCGILQEYFEKSRQY